MSILRSEDYLITTYVGEVFRRVIWHGDRPHELDIPHGWVLERKGSKFRIRNSSLKPFQAQLDDSVEFDIPPPGKRQLVELPNLTKVGLQRPLGVEITHMKAIDPVYMMRHSMAPNYPGIFPKQLMMFYGERYFLVRYRPVPPEYKVNYGSNEMFRYRKTETGYVLTATAHGLKLKTAKEKMNLPISTICEFTEQSFFSATLILGVHWWRFRMVPSPDSAKPVETEETEDDIREDLRFKQSALVFLIFFMLALGSMYNQSLNVKPEPRIIAAVEIKQPKLIPPTKEELKPPEPPPEPPKVEEPPPPKVVEEPPPPKPQKKPVKVVKKPPKIKPKKVAEVKVKPKPVPVVKNEPPPPPPPPTAAQIHAAETAAMKQDLLKKLNFISTSSNRAVAEPQNYDQVKDAKRFTNTPTLGGDVSKSNSLDKLVKDAPGDGRISTNSSRTVASKVDFGPHKGKGLNDVQGKVSLHDIYAANGKVGDSLGGPSLSITGPGEMSDGELEKALAKFIQRFNFCYEKALLTDAHLGGNVQIQWSINTSGKAQNPKVVSSQINNTDLHNCMSKVIKEIPFPKPKGGTVVVKKVFSFSSSTL